MKRNALIHLALALLWTFSGEPTPGRFLAGLLLGLFVLWAIGRFWGAGAYVRRALGFLRFLLVFARELVLSNLAVARTILFVPKEAIDPDFVRYDLSGLRPLEALILSHCVTLTPGTTSVEISPDYHTLIFHALDASDPEGVCRGIDETLKPAILAFTR
ncbi:MAG TPA: Na+/H+ antiporter subunit E [Chthoniobacteraceae bacterium]|nr:Na+/H+ antiporter subunit E [Chthoniobacteraceae bacterium]